MWHPSLSHGFRSIWIHVRWATCPAVLEGKTLQQIQRRIGALKRLQSSLLWPPLSEFEAFGRKYPLPVRACQPQIAEVAVERLKYLAGFLDGDGWVGSSKMSPAVSVQLSARSAEVLVLFRDAFGGGVANGQQGKGLKRPSLKWQLARKGACSLAESLVDYTVVKRVHLKLVANWPSERQQRNLAAQALSDLNHVNSPDTADESVNLSWAWLAGFVDAEGCIGIRPYRHACTFAISQKHKRVLERIRKFLEGNGFKSAKVGFDGRSAYRLGVSTQREQLALVECLLQNGLLLKRNQAETALKVEDLNHTELRNRMAADAGNQKRYSRLDSDGCQRAREIALLSERIRKSTKDMSKLKKLQVLREEHEFQNSITVYNTLRSDTKVLISQGAQKQHLVGKQA